MLDCWHADPSMRPSFQGTQTGMLNGLTLNNGIMKQVVPLPPQSKQCKKRLSGSYSVIRLLINIKHISLSIFPSLKIASNKKIEKLHRLKQNKERQSLAY